MKAPFLVERAIKSALSSQPTAFQNSCHSEPGRSLLLLASAVHNKLVGALVIARLVSAGRLAPRRHRMPSARGLAFTAAMRMVNWVHRNAPVMRTLAQPARPSRLADGDILVVDVPDLPDRRHAVLRNLARLTRRQLHQRVLRFLRH